MRALPINIGDLSILVYGYQYPDANEYWDGNWLVIDAIIESKGKQIAISADPCLRVPELKGFLRALKKLVKRRKGIASLSPLEPFLGIEVTYEDTTARVLVNVTMLLKGEKEKHSIQFACDLQQANGWISEIDVVLNAFPQQGGIFNVH